MSSIEKSFADLISSANSTLLSYWISKWLERFNPYEERKWKGVSCTRTRWTYFPLIRQVFFKKRKKMPVWHGRYSYNELKSSLFFQIISSKQKNVIYVWVYFGGKQNHSRVTQEVVIFSWNLIGWSSQRHPVASGAKMRSFLPAVAKQLFRDIQKTYQEASQSKMNMTKTKVWTCLGLI